MAVAQVKTVSSCKLCQHEKRAEIEAILELRSALTRDPDTKELIWSLPKVLKQLGEWGVVNPTEENVKVHWRKHCEVIKDETAQVDEQAALAAIEKLLAGGDHADVDDSLRLVITLWREQQVARLRRGEAVNISTQDMMKAAAELTKRAHNETQHELLSQFTQGLGMALGATPVVKQIEGAEVIDGELVEEAELVA